MNAARGLGLPGLGLRGALASDLTFLSRLYATTRAQEIAWSGWPESLASAFLESQFALQHRHFLTVGGATDCWVVEHHQKAIGRLYLGRAARIWRVLDIALLPEWQGRGIGAALLNWTKKSARAAEAEGVDLHVLASNPRAAVLYERLGFVATQTGTPTHRHMRWRVS